MFIFFAQISKSFGGKISPGFYSIFGYKLCFESYDLSSIRF